MKEVRPASWILLGVLTLVIFGPLFLLDIEPIQQLEPAGGQPADPRNPPVRPARRPPGNENPANKPVNDQPAANQPKEEPRDNGLVE